MLRVIDEAKAIAKFEKLCQALANVGLQTEVRNGDSYSVLLFVRVASDEHLYGEVYRSRQAHCVSIALLVLIRRVEYATGSTVYVLLHPLKRPRTPSNQNHSTKPNDYESYTN